MYNLDTKICQEVNLTINKKTYRDHPKKVFSICTQKGKTMITLFYSLSKSKLSKSVDISKYYRDIDELEPLTLRCGCGRVGSLIKHGKYQRDIIINDIVYEILRIKIFNCVAIGFFFS